MLNFTAVLNNEMKPFLSGVQPAHHTKNPDGLSPVGKEKMLKAMPLIAAGMRRLGARNADLRANAGHEPIAAVRVSAAHCFATHLRQLF